MDLAKEHAEQLRHVMDGSLFDPPKDRTEQHRVSPDPAIVRELTNRCAFQKVLDGQPVLRSRLEGIRWGHSTARSLPALDHRQRHLWTSTTRRIRHAGQGSDAVIVESRPAAAARQGFRIVVELPLQTVDAGSVPVRLQQSDPGRDQDFFSSSSAPDAA